MNQYDPQCFKADEEYQAAALLVRRAYAPYGYVDFDDDHGIRDTIGLLKKETTTVFGVYEGEGTLLGTMSLFSGEELPMDQIYREEVNMLREKGVRVAEAGQFAVDNEYLKRAGKGPGEALMVSKNLMSAVFNNAIQNGVEALCIAINPKHEGFYDALGFESIGALKEYPSVNGAPALAKMLRVRAVYEDMVTNKNAGSSLLRDIVMGANRP